MSSNSSDRLTFSIPTSDGGSGSKSPPLKIHLHQSQAADVDTGNSETNTGFVMWPSAVLLSHHISRNVHIVRGDGAPDGGVMELGAGCGLVGLTAAALLQNDMTGKDGRGNTDKVTFTDYNPEVLDNLKRNIELNEFDVTHDVVGLDWFDQQPNSGSDDNEDDGPTKEEKGQNDEDNTWVDTEGVSRGQFRLILGADLIVCTNDAELVANTIDASLMEGGTALIVSSDRRFGVNEFPDACRELGMDVVVDDNILEGTANGNVGGSGTVKEDFWSELELGGYEQRASTFGEFAMFTINKPIVAAA